MLLFLLTLVHTTDPSLICSACSGSVSLAQNLLTNEVTFAILRLVVVRLCKTKYSEEMCSLLWTNTVTVEIRNVAKMLDPPFVCGKLGLCRSPHIVPDVTAKYIRRVLKDAPPRLSQKARRTDLNNTLRFLVFTDPHIEYDYEEGRAGKCKEASCCRKGNQMATKPEERAGKYGFMGKCDLPPITLAHFVKTAIEEIKPDAFMWLGDNPSHLIWNQTQPRHLEGIRHVTKMILEHPQSKYKTVGTMYPILGNHEGLPCDIFDLEGPSHRWIIEDTARLWKQWLTPSAYDEYLRTGCYSQLHPFTRLRIIGLNDFVHDTMNSYLWKNQTNPLGVLDWLEKRLAKSERDGESVIILTHMPMNGMMTLSEWAIRCIALMERYKNIIKGIFHGHNHEDSFQVVRGLRNSSEFVSVGILNPTLGTYSNYNPAFRVFYVDKETYDVVDFDTMRLYVDEANKNDDPRWTLAYRFSTYYGYKDSSLESFVDIANRLVVDRGMTEKFIRMKQGESKNWPYVVNNTETMRFAKCRVMTRTYLEMMRCLGPNYYTEILDYIRYYLLGQTISRDWYYAVD